MLWSLRTGQADLQGPNFQRHFNFNRSFLPLCQVNEDFHHGKRKHVLVLEGKSSPVHFAHFLLICHVIDQRLESSPYDRLLYLDLSPPVIMSSPSPLTTTTIPVTNGASGGQGLELQVHRSSPVDTDKM